MTLELPVARWGRSDRPRLLLLHGFTGSRATFEHLVPRFSELFEVIAPELPGHGESPLPASTGPEGLEEILDSLEALLGDEDRPTDVLGYSQGARLALLLASRATATSRGASKRTRIDRLVLESGTPGLQSDAERRRRRAQDEKRADLLVNDGLPAFLERWEERPLFTGMRNLPEAERTRLRERRSAHRPKGLAGALRCMGLGVQPSVWPSLHRLNLPTLLITGARDEPFVELARKMLHELPMGWHRSFEDVWHAPHLETPDAYSDEVLAFLSARWPQWHGA